MSSVATAPILVTGATGRQGGTGRHAAAALLDRGLAVRALVRTLDERAESLAALARCRPLPSCTRCRFAARESCLVCSSVTGQPRT
jgi:nucleoside-diphosphate-sugar epimerase